MLVCQFAEGRGEAASAPQLVWSGRDAWRSGGWRWVMFEAGSTPQMQADALVPHTRGTFGAPVGVGQRWRDVWRSGGVRWVMVQGAQAPQMQPDAPVPFFASGFQGRPFGFRGVTAAAQVNFRATAVPEAAWAPQLVCKPS